MTTTESDFALVVLDMAGTTVADDGLVLESFAVASRAAGVDPDTDEGAAARQYVIDTMGQSKIVVFRALFGSEDRAQAANVAFEAAYAAHIDAGLVRPIEGAADTITSLRDSGVKVCFTTGFSEPTRQRLISGLGWETLADLALSPIEGGTRGRPYPDLIWTAAIRLGIDSIDSVAVVGDTAGDMKSGRSSGAPIVAGTLTGAHSREKLLLAGATNIITSVAELPQILTK